MKKLFPVVFAALVLSGPAFAQDALYNDLGGKAGIDRLVETFVDDYLADPRVKDFFSQSNMDRIRAEMKDQFCAVAGGPCVYRGHNMTITHKGLHLTNANFNAIVEDLQSAMNSCGIPFSTQDRLLARLAPMQHQVVTR
ncbi:MAG TPA: group 1 truncated hemoglobin [Rhizomicrobium sp.]|jgi:hemoglobin|nr:group 1 truncated hemoglobin [Rhizomicrobium sp.]